MQQDIGGLAQDQICEELQRESAAPHEAGPSRETNEFPGSSAEEEAVLPPKVAAAAHGSSNARSKQ
jgi:hypothetical protein